MGHHPISCFGMFDGHWSHARSSAAYSSPLLYTTNRRCVCFLRKFQMAWQSWLIPVQWAKHAASSSRKGLLKIAHCFSGGINDSWPVQSRQGRKTARMLVGDGGLEFDGGSAFEPLSSLPGLRIVALPTDKSVSYSRESLTGHGAGQLSRSTSLFAIIRVVAAGHSESLS